MNIPKTIEDLKKIIEMKVPESLHLDYKANPAFSPEKKDEICKDVSAFANSDGGMLIYGIREEKVNKIGYPASIDDGVDTSKFGKEWIDQILTSNIRPVLSGVEIAEIKISENRSVMVIHVPKSFRGPHQAPDKKYYKRRNVVSEPMEHYEIEDVRNRRQFVPNIIKFDVQIEDPWVQIIVENIGSDPACDVKFIFSENFSWHKEKNGGELPNALKNGIKFFPSKRKMIFNFGGYRDILFSNGKHDTSFSVFIKYNHPQVTAEVTEEMHFDLNDFLNSSSESNPLEELSSSAEKIVSKIDELCKRMPKIDSIAASTGINLSVSTLRNLHLLLHNDKEFKYKNINECTTGELREIFGIDGQLAANIRHHYTFNNVSEIKNISRMTDELLEKINNYIKKADNFS